MSAACILAALAAGGGERLVPGKGPSGLHFLFPLGFVSLWCFICFWLAHWGGWARLALRYRTYQRPGGVSFRMASAGMGWVNYSGCLSVTVAPDGLYLAVWPIFRLGHPPILIPWEEMGDFKRKRFIFWKYAEVTVGSPPITRLRLPLDILEARLSLVEGGKPRPPAD